LPYTGLVLAIYLHDTPPSLKLRRVFNPHT
jgi:hypothetical protein